MAGETIVRINDVPVQTWLAGHPSIDFGINRRGLARLDFTDRANAFTPALFDECVIELEGLRVYGGTVQTIRGKELSQTPTAPTYATGTRYTLEVTDYAALADRMLFNAITPAGTLRAAVAVVAAVLAPFGVTLGAGPSGPAVPALGFPFASCRVPLDELCRLTGYGWRIDPFKVLHLQPGGAVPAPRAISLPDGRIVAVAWEQTQATYRSHQWVQFGETGVRPFTMTATSDGIRTVYPLIGLSVTGEIRPTAPVPTVTVGPATLPVSYVGDAAHDWWYREEPGAVQLELRPGAAIPAAGVVITTTFPAQYPGAVFRAVAGPVVEAVDTMTTTDDPIAASQFADALLRQYGITPKTVTIETRYLDYRPGQSLTVTLPAWGLNGVSCLIETVELRHVLQTRPPLTHAWVSRLTLIEGDESRGSWLDFWRDALTIGSGSGSSFTGPGAGGGDGGGGTTTIAGGPVYAGGSRAITVTGSTAWTPISEFVDVLLPASTAALAVYTCRCHAWLTAASGTIAVRVVALESGGLVCGTSAATAATDWSAPAAFLEFDISLRPAAQYYRVEAQITIASNEGSVAAAMLYPKGAA